MSGSSSLDEDRQLMRVHIETLFTHDDRGRMVRVNEPGGGGPAPRFFLGRTRGGNEWRVRDDMADQQILDELAFACSNEVVEDALASPQVPTPYEAILSRSAPIQRMEAGPAFHFPPEPLPGSPAVIVTEANAAILEPHLSSWLDAVAGYQPMLTVTVGGEAVAICASVRITVTAHEAGVETAPDYRGCGYATAAVAAWSNVVRQMGAMPLYSTSWQNVASRALARKLGLRLFGADFHIT